MSHVALCNRMCQPDAPIFTRQCGLPNRKGIVRMKRNLLALAVAAASVMSLVAQAAPTVYGRLNLSIDYVDVNDDNNPGVDDKSWNVHSNASRLGVKGNEKLTDDFTAVYKAEWEVSENTGRRYALTSGDFNLIHIHAITAKAFGFKQAIAHGMWSKAKALSSFSFGFQI